MAKAKFERQRFLFKDDPGLGCSGWLLVPHCQERGAGVCSSSGLFGIFGDDIKSWRLLGENRPGEGDKQCPIPKGQDKCHCVKKKNWAGEKRDIVIKVILLRFSIYGSVTNLIT